jgi:hypothetical protein
LQYWAVVLERMGYHSRFPAPRGRGSLRTGALLAGLGLVTGALAQVAPPPPPPTPPSAPAPAPSAPAPQPSAPAPPPAAPAPQPAPGRPGQPAPPEVVGELRGTLSRVIQRFEARDLNGVLAHISEQYKTGPFTKPTVRTQLGAMFRIYDAMRATVRVDEVRIVGEQAWVWSTGEAAGRLPYVGQWIPLLWWERELEIARRENGVWRLFGYQQ